MSNRSRRSILRSAGTIGSLTIAGGILPNTDWDTLRTPPANLVQQCPREEEPPQTCDEATQEIEGELALAREALNACVQQAAEFSQRNLEIEAEKVRRGQIGFCRESCQECGHYCQPDCGPKGQLVDDLEQLLQEAQQCQDVPAPSERGPQQPLSQAIENLQKQIAGQKLWRDALIDALRKARIMRNIAAAAATSLPLGPQKAMAAAMAALWAITVDRLSDELATVTARIAELERGLQDLQKCLEGGPQANGGFARELGFTPLVENSIRASSRADEVMKEGVYLQEGSLSLEYEPEAFAFEEVRIFEPWPVAFESMEDNVESAFQSFTTGSLYLWAAQYNLSVSLARFTLVHELRSEYQSMWYVPLPYIESLARFEFEQAGGVAYNAEAAAGLVETLVGLQSDMNAAWDSLRSDVIDLPPNAARQQFQNSWNDEESRQELLDPLNLPGVEWYEFTSSLNAATEAVDFRTPVPDVFLDAEWVDGMERLTSGYLALHETFNDIQASLGETWNFTQ